MIWVALFVFVIVISMVAAAFLWTLRVNRTVEQARRVEDQASLEKRRSEYQQRSPLTYAVDRSSADSSQSPPLRRGRGDLGTDYAG